MRLRLGDVFADAAALWRSERELLVAVAGVFFLIPMLGLVLLLGTSGIGKELTPEQFSEALIAFQTANIVPIFLAGVILDFGTFAVLNLFLQGGGRTLGQVLGLAAIRFMPFVAISMVASAATSIGLSLFVLPGLFVFARTWLIAPAYAAAPERGVLAAVRQGWLLSGGIVWLAILGTTVVIFVPMLFAAVVIASLVTGLAVLAGAGDFGSILGNLVIAGIGAAVWATMAVLRVAFYRALAAPNIGT